jgi:hypothetical protein
MKRPGQSAAMPGLRMLHRLSWCLLLSGLFNMPARAEGNQAVEFFRAVAVDNHLTVAELLRAGVDPNLREPVRQDTGLIRALREDAMHVFTRLLAEPGIDVDAQASNGDTAIMIAAFKGNLPAVRALLDHEALINRPGWTALHYAAASGNTEIAAILLDHYAYIDAASPNRTTPLMMAARERREETMRLLLSAGADATLRNEAGYTAMDFARENDFKEIQALLAAYLSDAAKK